MTPKELKSLISNSVRQPVRVCLADGESCLVTHPDFAFVAANDVIFTAGPGAQLQPGLGYVICPVDHVIRVELLNHAPEAKA